MTQTDYAYFSHLVLPNTTTLQEGLYLALRNAVLEGALPVGARLPSSRILAEMMSISRNSALAAIERLLDEGYVISKPRSGIYVAEIIPDQCIQVSKHQIAALPAPVTELCNNPNFASILTRWSFPRLQKKKVFHVGVGCVDVFPQALWGKMLSRAWRQSSPQLGQFHDPRGYLPLRRAICQYALATRGLRCHEEQVIIVNGTQQAIHLTAYALLQPQDQVALDDPGYDSALNVFHSFGAIVHSITSDSEGMSIPEIIQQYPETKLVYTAPSHQFPLGGTLSLNRRFALLDWAAQQQKWIFEDDYNSEFRYGTHPLQALQGLDQQQRVIYSGTFSKMMFPELRLGFMVVPEALIELFGCAKYYVDTRSSYLEQIALASFMEEGHYARHVRKVRKICYERQQALIQLLQAYLSDALEVQPTDSGIHLVCWLKAPWTEERFIHQCSLVGLSVQPLSRYCQTPYFKEAVLFGYAAHDIDEMEGNIQALAEQIKRVN